MKPPRVYIRGRYFWVEYWNPQTKRTVKTPILDGHYSIEVDAERTDSPDWWKKSKKRKAIGEFLDGVELTRVKLKNWEPIAPKARKDLSLDELLKSFNEEQERLRGTIESVSLLNHVFAVKWLQKQGLKTVRQVTPEKVLEARRSATIGASTLQAYFARLRPMFAYAVKLKAIHENPFQGVRVKVGKAAPKGVPIADQLAQLSRLFDRDPMLCAQVLYTRLGGYRAKDSCTLEIEHVLFKENILEVWNNKGKRWEKNPMSRAMKCVLTAAIGSRTSGKVFPLRHPKALYKLAHEVTGLGIHIYKKCFADEIAPFTESDDLKRYLLHHQAVSMAMIHYQKSPVEQGRNVLNEAQKEIADWVQTSYNALIPSESSAN